MNFVTTQDSKQAIIVPQVRRLKIRWNDDSPEQSLEIVYVVLDEPEKELLVFYLLDEDSDGRLGFRGPYKGVFDGDVFPRQIRPFSPILKKLDNMKVHRANMDAIAVLLNAEYKYVTKGDGLNG